MRSKKTSATQKSWSDQNEFQTDQSSTWLDLYRRHLSWIKSSENLDEEDLLKDIASEL